MSELPSGWLAVTVKDVADLRSGFGFPISLQGRPAGELGFYKVGDISQNWQRRKVYLSKAEHYISHDEAEDLRAVAFPAGSVVFAKIGAAVALNRRAILKEASLLDNNVMGLAPHDWTTPEFLFHFMCQVDLGAKTRGGNVPSLRKGDVEEIPFPLPPLAEQKRIVAKIEELFSELEAGEESLRVARRQLGVYRQSLLKQAFEGKLTAHWRTQNPAKLESPAQLLARIREAKNSLGIRESQIPPEVLDRARVSLPSIPADWHWLRLENLALIGTGMSVSQARLYDDPIEVPYLRVANVQRGRLDLAEMRTMLVEKSRLADLRLKPRDILFNEGGDRDKLGRGWVWSGQIDPCITQNHVFRATVFSSSIVLPEFVSHWGNAFGQDFFHLTGKQTTNLASISKAALSSLPVPVPPVEEQKEILRLLDEQFEVIERNEREIDAALKRSEVLRQAILKKAFTGRLVPQDPADEPAIALLARLRTERMSALPARRKPVRT